VLGGALGILAGLAFADLLENYTGVLKTFTPASSIYLALIMATVVGILSGIYPAYRASRLDPVEALRYE
jgi:putative ABC transport system permease protein